MLGALREGPPSSRSGSPSDPRQITQIDMMIIALVVAGNLLIAGLFSLVAVTLD